MAKVTNRVGLIFVVSLGLAFWVTAAVLAGFRAAEIHGFRHTEGTVIGEAPKGRGVSPIVEFTTPGGSAVHFTSGINSPLGYDVGEHPPVIYSPSDPSHAFIDSFWTLWFLPTLFTFLGMPWIILFSVLWRKNARAAKRSAPGLAGT